MTGPAKIIGRKFLKRNLGFSALRKSIAQLEFGL
jgi:hypothetical protein